MPQGGKGGSGNSASGKRPGKSILAAGICKAERGGTLPEKPLRTGDPAPDSRGSGRKKMLPAEKSLAHLAGIRCRKIAKIFRRELGEDPMRKACRSRPDFPSEPPASSAGPGTKKLGESNSAGAGSRGESAAEVWESSTARGTRRKTIRGTQEPFARRRGIGTRRTRRMQRRSDEKSEAAMRRTTFRGALFPGRGAQGPGAGSGNRAAAAPPSDRRSHQAGPHRFASIRRSIRPGPFAAGGGRGTQGSLQSPYAGSGPGIDGARAPPNRTLNLCARTGAGPPSK